jgi:hypothetical protein
MDWACGVRVNGSGGEAPFADAVRERLEAKIQAAKHNELHTFAVIPSRWIVECSFSGLEQSR